MNLIIATLAGLLAGIIGGSIAFIMDEYKIKKIRKTTHRLKRG